MKLLFTILISVLCALAERPQLHGAEASRARTSPNIIIVMPDDAGYGDYACLGNPVIRTPSVDAFKKQSLLFTRFHVSPTCAPCRGALMSGRHEFKNGITHTIGGRERMALGTRTLPQMLKSAGYTTGIFGKWHLGDEEAYRPENRGFDEVYIHGSGGIGQSGDAPGNSNHDPTLWHNGEFVSTKGYCTDLFFAQAIHWMKQRHQADEPFFAYVSLNAPHAPHVLPEECYKHYLGKPGVSEGRAKFFGMIENIDTNFGKLLGQLDEWDIADNTLVNNEELYDLNNDPGETRNVIAEHPKVVAELRAAYEKWWAEVQPHFVNEDTTGFNHFTFRELFEKQFGKAATVAAIGRSKELRAKRDKKDSSGSDATDREQLRKLREERRKRREVG